MVDNDRHHPPGELGEKETTMLSAYRSAYLRMNGITHAEIWETDEGYQLALCSAPGIGFRESPEFGTPDECIAWLRNVCDCAELDVR